MQSLLAAGIAVVSLALGCSTTSVDLRYAAGPQGSAISAAVPRVVVGELRDARGTGDRRLGAIRSGVGNPMKRLVLEKPAAEVVAQAFADALRERGLLASDRGGAIELTGMIEKLDCNQFSYREAHVIIRVQLTEVSSGRALFDEVFRSELVERGGVGGPFGSTEGLRAIAERALREVVDAAIDHPLFRGAL